MDRERWVAGWLVVALPIRVLLDVLHGIEVAGWSVGRLGGGLLGLSFVGCAAALSPELRRHPLRVPLVVFVLLIGVGAARTVTSPVETARLVLLYLAPIAFGLAASVVLDERRQTTLLGATAMAAAVPIALSIAAWSAGSYDPVLHGYPRLVGAYSSHHNHAVAMGLFVVLGVHLALGRRVAGAVLALVAAPLLWLTYVRTVQLFVVIAALGMLLGRGRWRAAVGVAVVAGLSVLIHPTLRDRFADVIGVLTLRPPEEGWGAVGSWRFRIWADSWEAFVAQGPVAWFAGLGLGGHRTLHRQLDPHNEYLALWYQLGIAGPLVYLWMFGVALRAAVGAARTGIPEHARGVGALTIGTIVAVILTGAISNDFLPRPLLATFVWGAAGLVWSLSSARADGAATAQSPPRGSA